MYKNHSLPEEWVVILCLEFAQRSGIQPDFTTSDICLHWICRFIHRKHLKFLVTFPVITYAENLWLCFLTVLIAFGKWPRLNGVTAVPGHLLAPDAIHVGQYLVYAMYSRNDKVFSFMQNLIRNLRSVSLPSCWWIISWQRSILRVCCLCGIVLIIRGITGKWESRGALQLHMQNFQRRHMRFCLIITWMMRHTIRQFRKW